MDTFKLIYGTDMPSDPKALVIGAGGIGCELLKNLAMTGFKSIEVIDLDTIDISNLNRQFLFTRKDVGKPKSEVAANAIKARFPDVSIKSHVGNIKDPKFRSDFFKQFDIIFNALDNIEARKHVSRVWIALDKPLIDGGSTGFIGTTVSIVKNKTPCYECIEKPTPKQFPVCTIRSTPDKMIHCIVWAKLLLSALFGPPEEVNFLEDIRQELADIVQQRDSKTLCETVFRKLFDKDIEAQIELRSKVANKDHVLGDEDAQVFDEEQLKIAEKLKGKKLLQLNTENCITMIDQTEFDKDRVDTEVWELNWYIQMFFHCIQMIIEEYSDKIGNIEFDKDDEILLDFVIAASNLRAYNYWIPLENGFKIKQTAGNIIPAVSSTNGLVAGLETIEGLKILADQISDLRAVTFSTTNDKRKITGASMTCDINPSWMVCSNICLQAHLEIPPTFTLSSLLTQILTNELSICNPSVEVNNNIIYESGDDLDDDEKEEYQAKLGKRLEEVGIKDGDTLYVDDFGQDFKWHSPSYVEIHYSIKIDTSVHPNGYILTYLNKASSSEEESKIDVAVDAGSSTEVGINEEVKMIPHDSSEQIPSRKRKSDDYEGDAQQKRMKDCQQDAPIDID
jgi:ubiquitin-like 1-activating enzyme E1 B